MRNSDLKVNHNYLIIVALFVICVILQGCATASKKDDPDLDPVDPHETVNRASYDLTDRVDRLIFEPVVNVYIDYVPNAASSRTRMGPDNRARLSIAPKIVKGAVKYAPTARLA